MDACAKDEAETADMQLTARAITTKNALSIDEQVEYAQANVPPLQDLAIPYIEVNDPLPPDSPIPPDDAFSTDQPVECTMVDDPLPRQTTVIATNGTFSINQQVEHIEVDDPLQPDPPIPPDDTLSTDDALSTDQLHKHVDFREQQPPDALTTTSGVFQADQLHAQIATTACDLDAAGEDLVWGGSLHGVAGSVVALTRAFELMESVSKVRRTVAMDARIGV
ncbi:hypothetical protein GGF32_009121 [Allomyces javanicus]|nr:hypothetical protein GGF32_009121 [Allomyces javanicus]